MSSGINSNITTDNTNQIYLKDIKDNQSISSDIIGIIIILIFLIFICWILYKVSNNQQGNKLLIACQAGLCGTNIYNGEKRCPRYSTDVVLIDGSYEVCNSRFTCDNPKTPYALLTNGSTNLSGVCDTDTICRCLTYAQCATHVTTLFQSVNGTSYSNSRSMTFNQIPMSSDLGTDNVTFTDLSVNFCGIKTNNLNRLSPGSCTFSDFDYNTNNNSKVYFSTECINSNPCSLGIMAFDTNNPAQLEEEGIKYTSVINTPVTCVNSKIMCDDPDDPDYRKRYQCENNQCTPGSVPYWDQRWGYLRCTNIQYELTPTT
jgi:hypothetical protein